MTLAGTGAVGMTYVSGAMPAGNAVDFSRWLRPRITAT